MNINELWIHKISKHETEMVEVLGNQSHMLVMLVNLIQEQGKKFMLEITKLGEVFDNFGNFMVDSFNELKEDVKSKKLDITEVVTNLENENPDINKPEKSLPSSLESKPSTSKPSEDDSSDGPFEKVKLKSNRKASSKQTQVKPKTSYLRRANVLFVGDSVAHDLKFREVEKITNTTIKTARGYSSVWEENSRFRNLNLTKVSKEELKKETL